MDGGVDNRKNERSDSDKPSLLLQPEAAIHILGAGTLGAIAGTLVNCFASLWSKTLGGGHG